jgi:hypothetical protein
VTAREQSADEDALYVLTAVLLTPAQFPSVLGDDFPEACAALGLPADARGYGLVLGQDGTGARWTVAVDDVSLVAVAIASWDCGMEYDLSPGDETVVGAFPGWPLALSVAAPGVPAPHDPPPEPGAAPLAPPDTGTWGPAQRRLGADEIAQRWAEWRAEFEAAQEGADTAATGASAEETWTPAADGVDAGGDGGDGPAEHPAASDETPGGTSAAGTAVPPAPSHPGVRHVLEVLHGYLDSAPPPGRVRSSFAPEGARTLRADGPGWSFVARTDDMAFVLLDDEPGEVLPVGRGTELPKLLTALDAMAVRPA